MKLLPTKSRPSIEEQIKQMRLYKPIRANAPNASVTSSPDRSGMLYLPKHARETLFLLRIDRLHPYAANPFKPYSEEKMAALMESIRRDGLQHPIIVRDYKDTDEYEILSGHNRVEAIRRLGEEEIPAVCMDDDKAALIVVATNFEQREKLLPSEKAFAYELIMHTYKNGTDPNSINASADLSTGWTGDSSMAYYYIRLTKLLKELLEMVDADRIPVKGGAELSYIIYMGQFMIDKPCVFLENLLSCRNTQNMVYFRQEVMHNAADMGSHTGQRRRVLQTVEGRA